MASILWNLTNKVSIPTNIALTACQKCRGRSNHTVCSILMTNLKHELQRRHFQVDSSTKHSSHTHYCSNFLSPKSSNEYDQLNNCILFKKSYSTSTDFAVTLETIYSDENKRRVQSKLPTVKPTRALTMKTNYRKAAVLVPLCHVNGEPSILFMVRSKDVPNHRGEICFPGGMWEEGDSSITQTALRETNEEIGIDIDSVDVWGPSQPSPSRDGAVLVTPIISYCGHLDISQLSLNTSEVETVFTRTVASLCTPSNNGSTQFRSGYTLPLFIGGQHRIWGLTAIVLHQSLNLIAPGLYTYKVRHNS